MQLWDNQKPPESSSEACPICQLSSPRVLHMYISKCQCTRNPSVLNIHLIISQTWCSVDQSRLFNVPGISGNFCFQLFLFLHFAPPPANFLSKDQTQGARVAHVTKENKCTVKTVSSECLLEESFPPRNIHSFPSSC